MQTRFRLLSALAFVAVAVPVHASTTDDVRFGPPWISIETPANPHHPSTRDASFLVRTYHHSESITVPVRAVAEGLVNGERRSHPLDIAPTNLPGVYAVRCDLPADGTWIVAVTLEQSPGSTATALVALDAEGAVARVEVPTRTTSDGWVVPIEVSARDIEARLRAADRLGRASGPGSGIGLHASLAGLLVLGIAAGARRRTGR